MGAMTCRPRNFDIADVDVLAFLESASQCATARHMLHLGERSSDLKTLPMASCRQCQTSLGFGGLLLALSMGFLAIARRCGGSDGAIPECFPFRPNRDGCSASLFDASSSPVSSGSALALASRQRRPEIAAVSGPAGAASSGSGCAAGMVSLSARMSDCGSRSDFAASFGTSAISVRLGFRAISTASDPGRVTTLIAMAGPRPTRQKTAIHIVLDIFRSQRLLKPKVSTHANDGNRSSRLNSGAPVAKQL